MITLATGRPACGRLSRTELLENEVRPDLAQGPVPACLRPGYTPPPAVVHLPPPPTCAAPAPAQQPPPSRRGRPKLSPAPTAGPLTDLEVRKTAIAVHLADGAWRTAWELAEATGLHPEVVRTTLHSMRAVYRPVPAGEVKARGGALIEYAAEGTPGVPEAQERRRQPARWTHAFCEVCETVCPFGEAEAAEGGTDLVCSKCGGVIATLYRGTPRPAPAGASRKE